MHRTPLRPLRPRVSGAGIRGSSRPLGPAPRPARRTARRGRAGVLALAGLALVALLALPVLPAGAVAPVGGGTTLEAQIPEGVEGTFRPHPEAEKAISRLLSPFCPGFMLSQCPASESLALRDSLQALALQGWNADALEAWMLSRHGEEYRAVPKRSGLGLLAWLFPPLALLAGLGVVGGALRRFLRPGTADTSTEADTAVAAAGTGAALPSSEEEARLREAIRDLEFSEDPVY